jgi:aminoglycoside 2''-phosphotransferase
MASRFVSALWGRPVVFLGEGDFCVGYATEDGRVVRVPKHAEAARSLRREACVMPRIAPLLPVPVPVPRLLEPERDGCPPVAVHERVPGDELTREAWSELAADDRERLAAGVSAFLRALHTADVGLVAGCGVEVLDHAAEVRSLRERTRARLAPLLPDDVASRLDEAFGRFLAGELRTERAVLLHRDVAPGHVMYDPGTRRATGVIDFGDLAIGDPARDFIYVHEAFGPEFLALTLRHYGLETPDALLPRVRFHYLAALVEWVLGRFDAGRGDELREGIDALCRELGGWN